MSGPPGTITEHGHCPSCEAAGEVGTPCPDTRCARYGYHFIPEDAFELRTGKDGLPDTLLGLDFGGYLVTGALGEGGIGKVYRARQRSTGMPVALKVLKAKANQAFRDRFEGEARALANLAHPNIVGLRNFGVERGQTYIVMEFIEGQTLRAFLKTRPPLDALRPIYEELLDALAYAHQRDIIHRDIKPDNIMLQPVGNRLFVRLLDFGLAKDIVDSDATSILGGTPAYMAPEQMRRVKIGPWTDLFAVGCMAYEALIGARPYSGMSALMRDRCKVDRVDFNPAANLSATQPAPIATFLQGALAHDTGARFQNAHGFRLAMRAAFDARLGVAPVVPVRAPAEPSAEAPPAPTPAPQEPSTPADTGGRSAGLIGVLLLVGLTGIGALAWSLSGPSDDRPDARARPDATITVEVLPASAPSTAPATQPPSAPATQPPTAPASAAPKTEAPPSVPVERPATRAPRTRAPRPKPPKPRPPATTASKAPKKGPDPAQINALKADAGRLDRTMRDCRCDPATHRPRVDALKARFRALDAKNAYPKWLTRLEVKSIGPGKFNCARFSPPAGWRCRYGKMSEVE